MKTNRNDSILDGITFSDLIVTLQSNEPTINREVVTRVFEEILKLQLEDARALLRENMEFILSASRGCAMEESK